MGAPRNGEMETVATDAPWLTAMAIATKSSCRCHRPKRSLEWHMSMSKIFQAMTGNPNGLSKLRKYHEVLLNLRLRDHVKPFEINFLAAG